jgi:hypothetical protein
MNVIFLPCWSRDNRNICCTLILGLRRCTKTKCCNCFYANGYSKIRIGEAK